MNNKIFLLILITGLGYFIGCGIEPPKKELDRAKKEIEKLDRIEASKFAGSDYKKTVGLYNSGRTNMVEEKDSKNKEVKKNLDESINISTNAYRKAAPKYASHYIKDSKSSEKKAQDIKANVAVKDDFQKANKLQTEADSLYKKKDFETAAKKAKEAKVNYEQAYDKAVKKKARSEKEIKEANDVLKSLQSQ